MKTETIENIPEWATTYIMYGDASGLAESDRREVDRYLDGLRRDGFRLIAPIEGTHNDCCCYPEFGLACATEDWTAEDMNANKTKWEVRWIDAVCDEQGEWTYNDSRHVCEIEVEGERDVEKAKAALLDFLRRDKCHAENIEDGFYDWNEVLSAEPVVVELVARGNRQPLYSMSPID